MSKIFSFLYIAIVFSFFTSCNSKTEVRDRTENSNTVSVEKNDTVSVDKTDSLSAEKKEIPEEPTVKTQSDPADFHKVLTFKKIMFEVKATGKGSLQEVTIQPSGLSLTNRKETLKTDPIVNAVINDLNSDNSPELLIFTQSAGSGSYGKVIAFSVNNGKSMSRVTFPETSADPNLNTGYRGHDKFTVVNNILTQEFPVYNEGDANSKPTGMKMIVTYKLKNGEASRIFVVDQVKEVEGK